MQSSRIRRLFLDFFVAQGHREVPSSSLVPADDPTLLFTNAGMVQFKRTFLGQEQRDYSRATTCQKCVRAGGKHNDLEQVGHTKRHHTFFEMLGNFSFGDYFKRDAIAYAWEFVTSPEYLGIAADRLRVTVHHTDHEARADWREISGLPDHRIYGLGDKDNFWQMGDTGPCGPCTEIYVDLEWRPGNAPAEIPQAEFEELAEAGRFLEIWNLVFMQYDRSADGTLTPLPKPSVDTGAGLERIAAVMQGEDDNFHTDVFLPLIDRVGTLVGRPYDRAADERASYRVLADHARAVSFLLADGVYPGNEGRGYVLRRILRRAVRHAWLLGRREPTLAPLTEVVVAQMGDMYPELNAKAGYIREVTENEEHRFLETIEGGLRRLDEIFASGTPVIAGEEAFRLYDTFGFPIDLTAIIAEERGVQVDTEGFERALEEQRKRSRAARVSGSARLDLPGLGAAGSATVQAPNVITPKPGKWRSVKRGKQKFVGYRTTEADSDILAFRQEGPRVDLVLRENPFYAESGGQVSDVGGVTGPGWTLAIDSVRKDSKGTVVSGSFAEAFEPDTVRAAVDAPRRHDIERNHSATHLVHYALRRHLGPHVRQQGSLVEPDRLRFDFSHHGPIEPAALEAIEQDVNALVLANAEVTTREMAYPDALALGAMAFFSEKYGDVVRVVQMGPSVELCGGTHVRSTGQIGTFRFSGQTGVAAGCPAHRGGHRHRRAPRGTRAGAPPRPGGRDTQDPAGAPRAAGRAVAGRAAAARGPARGRTQVGRWWGDRRRCGGGRRRVRHDRGHRLGGSRRGGTDRRSVPRGQAQLGPGAVQQRRPRRDSRHAHGRPGRGGPQGRRSGQSHRRPERREGRGTSALRLGRGRRSGQAPRGARGHPGTGLGLARRG